MDDVTAAKMLIRLLDLTSLSGSEKEEDIAALCSRSRTPFGNTAAICIYPGFIPAALGYVPPKVKIATVVNFPKGGHDFTKLEKEISGAVKAGADEIDAVLPYKDFLKGNLALCTEFIRLARQTCGEERPLKIIIESGELQTVSNIRKAAELCIENGADFIKTSTGKSKVSATPEAANAILETIRASRRDNIGFKASGGIKTIDDAKKYLVLASSVMGPEWINPKHLRIGASSLLDSLLETIKRGY